MVNKAKKQGTTYESNIVKRLNENSNMKAQRFAEGGSNDLGDIQLFVDGVEYFKTFKINKKFKSYFEFTKKKLVNRGYTKSETIKYSIGWFVIIIGVIAIFSN